MLRIHATLLENLFVSPHLCNEDLKNIFDKLRKRMFPCEETFISFLQAQSVDFQYEMAEEIIHRLCYDSNFPPSFYAIKDIISIEEAQNNKYYEYDSYIPRDHFIHIVNLYLLGLYVFFYQSEIRNRIINENRFQRTSTQYSQYTIDSYKDFISEWKYFCLFHDVGYAQEFFGNELKVVNAKEDFDYLIKSNNDFKQSFSKDQIIYHNAFFGAIEILSRQIMWIAIKEISCQKCDSNFKLFDQIMGKGIKVTNSNKTVFDEDFYAPLCKMKKIEKIFSNQCLKPLLPIIGEENVAVVGISRQSGAVSFVSMNFFDKKAGDNSKQNSGYSRQLIYVDEKQPDTELERIIINPYILLFDDFVSDKYELFYLYDEEKSDEYVKTHLLVDYSNLESAYLFFKDIGFDKTIYGISSEDQMQNAYFHIYMMIMKSIRNHSELLPDEHGKLFGINTLNKKVDLKENIKIREGIQNALYTEYSDRVRKNIIELLTALSDEQLKEDARNIISSQDNIGVEGIAKSYIELLESYLVNDIKKSLLERDAIYNAKERIRHKTDLVNTYVYEYLSLRTMLFDSSYNDKSENTLAFYYFDYANRKSIDEYRLLNRFIPKEKGLLKNCDVYDFVNGYMSKLTKDNEKAFSEDPSEKNKFKGDYRSTLDHGFESAKYASSVFSVLQSLLQNVKDDEKESEMIDILFSISPNGNRNERIKHYVDDYQHIFSNVIYAIITHNVYPENSPIPFLVSIEDTPFAFFALLCDSIQEWNRPQGLSHSLVDIHPYSRASEEFNVVIKNNKILLCEMDGKKEDLRKRISNMKNLKNISSFLSVG